MLASEACCAARNRRSRDESPKFRATRARQPVKTPLRWAIFTFDGQPLFRVVEAAEGKRMKGRKRGNGVSHLAERPTLAT